MAKKPNIRFVGFEDDWEQRKLGEIMVSLQNNTLSRANLSNETGIAKNVHYGDVLIKFGEVLDVSEESLPMISDEGVLTKYKASFLQNGDVIVADTAEDSTVGKCCEIAGLNDEVVLSGLHTIPYRPIEKFASGYLGYYLNSSAFHKQLIPLMQGIKVTSISKSAMQDTDIIYTKSLEEQGKIGNFFQFIDHLITLHQRKCDELKKVKKFMLQKMFPKKGEKNPEIRFDGFTNDWEQRKLGATNTFFTDGNYGEAYPKLSDMTDSGSGVPFLTGGNLKDGKLSLDGASYITPEKHSKLTSGHLLEDDIVIAVRGSLGALGYVNTDNSGWNINSQLAILRTDKSELYGKFLIQYLLSWTGQNELLKRQTGSALKQLPIGAIKDVEVPITSIAEQEKIGEYFADLDNLITLHQRKCEELKNVKKYMLQNMFAK